MSEIRKNRFLVLTPVPQQPTIIQEIWQQKVIEYLWTIKKGRYVSWMELYEKITGNPGTDELVQSLNKLKKNGILEGVSTDYKKTYRTTGYRIRPGTQVAEFSFNGLNEIAGMGNWIVGTLPTDRKTANKTKGP